ncbi:MULTISPECIES: deaminase [Prauserella salsuginis group]|uniref:tRNA(Arg) A34 adenosine deaminase TadA n=2 Tax=Prauserella salsuginis group TaxID=2893672 RepID=A0A839XIC7_9PSEU|nr:MULTISPECIES: deaminase [Prauserella salsuginis group]MBB3661314.1 tRNA(Arg) A34 adenosine deaminase TadA [Prauserella sediminis]MCR3719236.1 tRNA(Arg) A34 adenosine deaminase TadA [Prauserella flava]MCR3735751.1 tRNA(Arg) A34 adenosine deaminase TadA [Prauserella salsuginis]
MSADPAVLYAAMERAVEFGTRHVDAGGLPFVGVLVADDGRISAAGVNRVRETADPTAHAEIVAIRTAMATPDGPPVAGATLLATGEPCALCYDVAAERGIAAVRFAVAAETAAAWGFDYRDGYAAAGTDRLPLARTARPLLVAGSLAPFARYRALHRTDH